MYKKTHISGNKYHYRLYVPESLASSILQAYYHFSLCGHQGMYKTYKWFNYVVFWPKMWDDVKHFARSCMKCQIYKGENKNPCGKLQQTEVKSPNEMLGVDIMRSFPCSPNCNEYLLVFIDYYTRQVELFPMRLPHFNMLLKYVVKNLSHAGGPRLCSIWQRHTVCCKPFWKAL